MDSSQWQRRAALQGNFGNICLIVEGMDEPVDHGVDLVCLHADRNGQADQIINRGFPLHPYAVCGRANSGAQVQPGHKRSDWILEIFEFGDLFHID